MPLPTIHKASKEDHTLTKGARGLRRGVVGSSLTRDSKIFHPKLQLENEVKRFAHEILGTSTKGQ